MQAPTPRSARPGLDPASSGGGSRITSIDALRGLVMFTMIFVNDLAGASDSIVPAWMKHFHGRSGMTFVDLVFPSFLFIVGMSIPFSLGARAKRGQTPGHILSHVILRTLSLLAIGILMVNETPDTARLGWSGALWCSLMYLAAILAFSSVVPSKTTKGQPGSSQGRRTVELVFRAIGFVALVGLAFAFRGRDGQRIISLSPFSLHTEWYGILGLIGWTYLVGSIAFLTFGQERTALLGCVVLLTCLYAADRSDAFRDFWPSRYVGIGSTLGSQAAITVAGMLLATILLPGRSESLAARTRFTLLFIAGFAAAAMLLKGLYGINKNQATPSWCLWACAISAALWLIFYHLERGGHADGLLRPLAIAGENVLLAYLLSEMLPSTIELMHLAGWYDRLAEPHLINAIARSTACAFFVLGASTGLNRIGFRVRL